MVYCTVVFMHLDEWERFSYVREGFRVLRPGGRMLVDNINLVSDEGWARLCRIIEEIDPRERPEWIGTSSTPQELETYFRRAGFESIGQRSENIWVFTYGIKPAVPR
jgi:hypothetical protein